MQSSSTVRGRSSPTSMRSEGRSRRRRTESPERIKESPPSPLTCACTPPMC
ncbi:hypothetical protein CRUP_038857 [Coryphaenoides rupestris]|nr:hypothetical protein CRUP_038857 [Coryphaenoides rupestris]